MINFFYFLMQTEERVALFDDKSLTKYLARGGDANKKLYGGVALIIWYAIRDFNVEQKNVEILLRAGANANVESANSKTSLLDILVSACKYDLCTTIINSGVSPTLNTLSIAVKQKSNFAIEVANRLSLEELSAYLAEPDLEFYKIYVEPVLQKKMLESAVNTQKKNSVIKL